MACMLTREYIWQRGIYTDKHLFTESETRTITYVSTWSTVFKVFFLLAVTSCSVFQQKLENGPPTHHEKTAKNLSWEMYAMN